MDTFSNRDLNLVETHFFALCERSSDSFDEEVCVAPLIQIGVGCVAEYDTFIFGEKITT